MSDKERPLPKPPTKAFGRKKNFEEQEEKQSLLADRMALAAAEGKLDEFLKQELPDNEYARNLASMMMGMTGMMPAGPGMKPEAKTEEQNQGPEQGGSIEVPDDVRQAIMGGDVQNVMELLRREHQKRHPEEEVPAPAEHQAAPSTATDLPAIDKELVDALVRIASENSVALDWIIMRAIKLYVQEYQKTGKL